MENILNNEVKDGPGFSGVVFSGYPEIKTTEKNFCPNIKSINLSGNEWIIIDELPGVYCEGIQYYDLKNIGYINSMGMASLIELLKSLLEWGIEVQFVNASPAIKNKIKSLGLDHILICT
jgi:hypothetical protein